VDGVRGHRHHNGALAKERAGFVDLRLTDGFVDGDLPLKRQCLSGPQIDDLHEETAPVHVVVRGAVARIHETKALETTQQPRKAVTRFVLKNHFADVAEEPLLMGQPSRRTRMRLEGGCVRIEGRVADRHQETPK